MLQPTIHDLPVQERLDIENHMPVFQKRTDIKVFELLVRDCKYGGCEFFLRKLVCHFDAVFMPYYVRIGPRVVNRDMDVVLLQCLVNVDYFGIAHVRAVFLESESEDEYVRIQNLDAFFQHELDCLVSHILAHSVVHAAACKDDFRVVAVPLGALCKIIRVDTDAMSSDKARFERQEVPLRGSRFEHILSIDSQSVEYFGQFIDERDIYVPLRVLDYFCSFGYLYARSKMSSCHDYRTVDLVHQFAYSRLPNCRPRSPIRLFQA